MSKFHDIIQQLVELHDKKQADYGREHDPFANVRAAEDFGLPGYVGALIRANDKMRRLQKFVDKGELANESVEDAFMDLAVYAIIGLILYQEQAETKEWKDIVSQDFLNFKLDVDPFIKRIDKTFEAPRNFFWSSLLRGGDNAPTCDHKDEGHDYNSALFDFQFCPKCGGAL